MKKIIYPVLIFLVLMGVVVVSRYEKPARRIAVLSESELVPLPTGKPTTRAKKPKKNAPATLDMRKYFRRNYAPPDRVVYDTVIVGTGTSTSWNMRVERTTDYWQRTDSVEVIIHINGLGEVGSNSAFNNDYGPHYHRLNGWDGGVDLPSGTHYPMLITLQPSAAWPAESVTAIKLNAILARFRIKRRAVHCTGFSMGGWTWTTYVTSDPVGGPYTRASQITSIAENQGATPNANSPYPNLFDNFAIGGALGSGGNLLGIEQYGDGRQTLTRVNRMNAVHAGSFYVRTTYGGGEHEAFNSAYDPDETFTIANPEVYSLTPSSGVNMNIYQWMLLQGDTTTTQGSGGGSNAAPVAAAGTDVPITLPTTNTSLSGSGSTDADGTIASYAWSFVSGPVTPVIATPATVGTDITGLSTAGAYTFRLTVTDNEDAEDTDDVVVTVSAASTPRNYMEKNMTTSRVGDGIIFEVGESLVSGRVTTTEIYIPYINKELFFGEEVKGKDKIRIHANPNNGGVWNKITLGDVGGNFTDRVEIIADSVVTIAENIRIASMDSNVVCHAYINGLYNRLTKGVVYGFVVDRSALPPLVSSIGLAANLFHHLEISGLKIIGTEVGLFMKVNSDLDNPFTLGANFTHRNIYLHDIYMQDINGEAAYIGTTDIDGTAQSSNDDVPPPAGDSLRMDRIIINRAGWDGVQVSNFGYHCSVSNIVTWKTGSRNQSSQQWAIFIGGNTSGKLFNCVVVNSTGPLGALGKGPMEVYNNLVDSVNNGLSNADVMYFSQANQGVPTPYDPLVVNIHNNVTRGGTRHQVFVANTSGTMQPGFITNNVHAGVGGTFVSNAGDAMGFNASVPTYDIAANFSGSDAYNVYTRMRANPGQEVSFFDEEITDPVAPPLVDAGPDQLAIAFPTTTATLSATVTPADGYTATYEWTKLNAEPATIVDPTDLETDVTGLSSNVTYTFRITATQSDGQVITDDVVVVVNETPTRIYRPSIRIFIKKR